MTETQPEAGTSSAIASQGVASTSTPVVNIPSQPSPPAGQPSQPSTSGQRTPDARLPPTEARRTTPKEEKIENPEWGLKEIAWPPEDWDDQPQDVVKIVTQNANGPCSFIAICNILILRRKIVISPPDRKSASYEYLSALVGDYLVNTVEDVDLAAVFSVLPKTQYGLDLNPLFTGVNCFRPLGSSSSTTGSGKGKEEEEGGELKLFTVAGIKLVHGWLVDPNSQEYDALSKTEDYDTSVDAVVAGDIITSGRLVESDRVDAASARPPSLSPEDLQKVEEAMLIRQWLDSNPTQLTYYGLFALNDSPYIKPNELVCFFRGSHLNVLYKRKAPLDDSSMLFTLVTDRVFLREKTVVWETLVDVDGQSSSFVDSYFAKSTPVGGDYAGQTGEQIARAYDRREEDAALDLDAQLARRLQLEEDEHTRRAIEYQKQEELQRREDWRQRNQRGIGNGESKKNGDILKQKRKEKKEKSDCIIC